MLTSIVLSLFPLLFKKSVVAFEIIDKLTVCVFVFDYLLRLITAKQKVKKGFASYLLYPFYPLAIIDLLSILPSFLALNKGLKAFKVFRLLRTFKVFRSFKVFRYSKNIERIILVLKKQAKSLIAVASMAMFYIFFSALVMFNIEPNTFEHFFDALYWAAISLTSVGYGDITPTTVAGRSFTILSALVGLAVVALPSGIITAGYIDIINQNNKE